MSNTTGPGGRGTPYGTGGNGAGIWSSGPLSVTASTIMSNTTGSGGGLWGCPSPPEQAIEGLARHGQQSLSARLRSPREAAFRLPRATFSSTFLQGCVYNSAVAIGEGLSPPAARTAPAGSNVAVWKICGVTIELVGAHVP